MIIVKKVNGVYKFTIDVEHVYQQLINLRCRQFEQAVLCVINIVFEEQAPQENNQNFHDN